MRRSGISSKMHATNLPFSPRHSQSRVHTFSVTAWQPLFINRRPDMPMAEHHGGTVKKVLDRFDLCEYYKPKLKNYFLNAMKETLAKGNDRNTASPTESAVCGSWRREHSGAGDLNCRISHAARMTRCTR